MSDVETIHAQIRARLSEVESLLEPLRLEAEQLAKLAASFDAPAAERPRPTASPARSTTTSSARRKAAPRTPRRSSAAPSAKRGRPLGSGNRAHQAVAGITAKPGISASELATSMGISVNYLYRVLPRLEKEGKITKRGRGYHVAGEPATTTPSERPTGDA